MRHSWKVGITALALVGCAKAGDGGGRSTGGANAGTLTEQAHTSPDGKVTATGKLPAAWMPRTIANRGAVTLTQPHDGASPPAQVSVSVKDEHLAETTIERLTRKLAASAQEIGYAVVMAPVELAPGRWGYVSKVEGQQWMPGIDMYEAHALWKLDDQRYVDCWVVWNSATPAGAVELCKDLEVTAPAP